MCIVCLQQDERESIYKRKITFVASIVSLQPAGAEEGRYLEFQEIY